MGARMKYTLLPGLALLLLVAGAGCKGHEEKTQENKTVPAAGLIVAVGDSLTAGLHVEEEASYPAQLQKRLQAAGLQYRVINSGVSGETSSGTLSRLNWILTQKPDIVILETGANDGLRGLDPTQMEANLIAILDALAARHIPVLLSGMQALPNMGAGYGDEFRVIFQRLARRPGILFDPFFLEGVARDPALNQPDGLHPNAEGVRRIVARLLPLVETLLSEVPAR